MAKITFNFDGSGICLDPLNPLHLDGILAWSKAMEFGLEAPQRDENPEEIMLPLKTRHVYESIWIWEASALFPEGMTDSETIYWRKKFRSGRAHLVKGSPNLQMGIYREWNTPENILLTKKLVAYANIHDIDEFECLISRVKYIGRKRSQGFGKVISIEIDNSQNPDPCVIDGKAMRFYPHPGGSKLVRPRPPYWSNIDRVACLDVGEIYPPT